jgi:phage protein D
MPCSADSAAAGTAPSGAGGFNGARFRFLCGGFSLMAASIHPVRAPLWILTYQGVNITADVSRMVTEISYTNHENHLSDEIEVKLEDRDRRWQGPWSPTLGDTVTLQIGYAGEGVLPCGTFQVDELEIDGPPDTMHLKCIAAGITPDLRTTRSANYENQTLGGIAATIAARHGYSLVNAPNAVQLSFARRVQNRETDLQFLRRVALQYDYNFSVRGHQLIFFARAQVEAAAPVYTIERRNVTKFNFKSKTHQTYKAAQVNYQDPRTKSLVTATVTDPVIKAGDTLVIQERAENAADANQKALAAIQQHNIYQGTARLTLPGTTTLVAGNNVTISGWGVNDGVWMIAKSMHRLERQGGYSTEVELRTLGGPVGSEA